MKKIFLTVSTFAVFFLPSFVYGQTEPALHGPGGMGENVQGIADAMMKVIKARAEDYKSLKGPFYIKDADGNDYYTAKNADLVSTKQYVEVKKAGGVGFIAQWIQSGMTDNTAMAAMASFTRQIPMDDSSYKLEMTPDDTLGHNMIFYLKSQKEDGRRVAKFVFNIFYKQSTFVADNNL